MTAGPEKPHETVIDRHKVEFGGGGLGVKGGEEGWMVLGWEG